MQPHNKSAEYSNNIKQFSRFLVVGLSNFAISFAVFYILYNYWKLSGVFYGLLGEGGKALANFIEQLGAASLDATLANIVGYGAGVFNSFIWNKLWTFQVKYKTGAQFRRFLILNFSCLILSSAALFFFTDHLRWSYLSVWLVTMTIVTLVNFGVSKYWVYADSNNL